MRLRVIKGICAAVFLSSLLAPVSASASSRVYVRVGPPAPVVEVRPVSPGPRYVWLDGHQRWNGRAYVWVPGRWAVPPRARTVWVPGRWAHSNRGYYYVDGHWRR